MQSAALILVSLFSGAFLLALIGGMATLIVLHLRTQKFNKELIAKFAEFGDSLALTLEDHRREMSAIIEPAKASFTGIRQEVKASLTGLEGRLTEALKTHDQGFREAIGKFNPTALEAASVKIYNAASVLVKSASTLQALLVSHEIPEGAADLLPEQYAPSDTIYATVSESARLDRADARAEAEGNAPQFSGAAE